MLPLLPLIGLGLKVAIGAKVVSSAIELAPIISMSIKLATRNSITDYVNKNKDKYKSAIKYKIEGILKSGDYNTVKIGIYDDSNSLLANGDINCESVDDSVIVGQEIYI